MITQLPPFAAISPTTWAAVQAVLGDPVALAAAAISDRGSVASALSEAAGENVDWNVVASAVALVLDALDSQPPTPEQCAAGWERVARAQSEGDNLFLSVPTPLPESV